ncbi:MAG: alkaline phosphatase [Alcanivorax sp.]|nr:alkaline phosphatase [Alcanivorax sp.]MAY10963.1 alkaline phosphatase [Alcanivorax sp.]MBI56225.1 alkaline phosphatase [Alcanivorax sp.]HCE41898.1 alkaline phosphatase [Alcanivorax sp.]|tara:strand:- start:14385 stop:16274 length:1890 start_codon:yes stop_codon:yes gene_type:complete
MKPWLAFGAGTLLATTLLTGCGGDSDNDNDVTPPAADPTPSTVKLNFLGRHSSGQFDESAAEIPAYHAGSQRLFVVNANKGALDILSLADPANPTLEDTLLTDDISAGSEVNSVAVHGDLVAIAVQAGTKTDTGFLALYDATTLERVSFVPVGALPDMVAFTPDGHYVLTANEGEPNDDYSVDPEGSISVIDIRDPADPVEARATFTAFNGQQADLKAAGVRIYGPNANVARDLEPEYIAIADDSATAWVTLQENNALAKLDIASATVTDILPLGEKDLSLDGNGIDASDEDGEINIRTFDGVVGLYQPDAIHAYSAGGSTWLVTANEGDARAWGEDNDAYWGTEGSGCAGDPSQGFVEEFRVKHLVHASGFDRRCGDDLPPQLRDLAAGGLLNPDTFGYCGATAGDPGDCREDEELGRLNITWTEGYRKDENGDPMLFTAAGVQDDANGDRLMYDTLYAYGGRSFSIWDEDGGLVFDSGDAIERFLASDECMLGTQRSIPCKDYFNSGHDEGGAFDSRSDAKGPEPEGLTLANVGGSTFLFLGLERMGGILVYDVTNPAAPVRVEYLNTRDDWATEDTESVLPAAGDLGPEGLVFIPAEDAPGDTPLLVVGYEVSGTTAVYQVNLQYQ